MSQLSLYENRYGLMPPGLVPGHQSPAFLALAYARYHGVLSIPDHDEWGKWTLEELLRATRWLEGFLDNPRANRLMRANGWPGPIEWEPPRDFIVSRSGIECHCSQSGATINFDDQQPGWSGTNHTSSFTACREDEPLG